MRKLIFAFLAWWAVALAALALTLSGCGSAHHTLTFHQASGPPCHTLDPPQSGECIAQHFGFQHHNVDAIPLSGGGGAACQDWSQWQGAEPSTAGIACVIIQSNYGLHLEPTVWSQIHDAHAHHILCGLYTFMEGNSGGAEEAVANSVYRRSGCTLGENADAEINAAYFHACEYMRAAVAHHVLAELYGAPGMLPPIHCVGWIWPAEWGISAPYPFHGYPSTAIKMWQWCGTCGVDRDRDRGLIALARPPAPPPSPGQLRHLLVVHVAVLRGLERELVSTRAQLVAKRCAVRRHRHEHLGPVCRAKFRHGDQVSAHGRREDRIIARLAREAHVPNPLTH
jgi:hypothetical protein